MNQQQELAALLAAVEDGRAGGRDAKRVLADWLEENGLPDLAVAFRWAAHRGLHPHRAPKGRYFAWRREPPRPSRTKQEVRLAMLPRPVWDQLRPRPRGNSCQCKTTLDAFTRLANALAVLRGALECGL